MGLVFFFLYNVEMELTGRILPHHPEALRRDGTQMSL